jgi:hypothetical protein
MVGSPVFSYPNNQRLITEKAFDLRAGYHHARNRAIELSRCPDLWLIIKNRLCLSRD